MKRESSASTISTQAGFETLLNPSILAEARRVEFRTKRSIDSETTGRFRSSFRGSGLDFAELREYQPGDEVRRIDWRASVRTGRTYVKSYQEERTLNILLAIDCSRSTSTGVGQSRHHRGLEFTALVTMLARQSNDAVGLLRFSDNVEEFLPPLRKRSQSQRILCSLIEPRELSARSDLRPVLQTMRISVKRRTIIFLISDFLVPDFSEDLSLLAARHDVICVFLNDPELGALPKAGIVQIQDAESGAQFLVDTGNSAGREWLRNHNEEFAKKSRAMCTRAGADWIELIDHPMRPLMELMNRRSRSMR